MAELLHREFVYLWYYFTVQLQQLLPYWIGGMVIGSLVSVFGKQKIRSLLGRLKEERLGLRGILPAALLGVASPLCLYGTIPVAAALAAQGLRQDWIAAFMMTSILLNPQLILYSAALGIPALLIRIVT